MRMGLGMQARKSMPEETPATATRHSFTSTALDPDDFSDVFGGPPRTLLARKFSADFSTTTSSSSSSNFYSEVFRIPSPEFVFPTRRAGRVLPAFRIPASRGEGFYSDVFASGDGRKSRERSQPKSKSNSSSVLSSEELSPLRPPDGEDVALSSFTSKLRPINVPCRWNSTTMMPDDHPNRQGMPMPAFQCSRPSYNDDHHLKEDDANYNNFIRSSHYGFSRRVSSPETISVEPTSFRSIKVSVDDLELNSPSSPASSLCQEPEPKTSFMQSGNAMQEQEVEQEEDEVMSSYVIEINSDYREGTGEAVSIDEAIAWAKEKFQSQSSFTLAQQEKHELAADNEGERPNANEFLDPQTAGHETLDSPMEEKTNPTTEEGKEQSQDDIETELLDEEIRLWSAGKETNIRLLLSALHHVLWPNSGWCSVPLTSLIESSHVKKAYQKARLCLHPDKLQQRGATAQQKYVAEKVFSVLQDAWSAFISEDVFF
ncbi:Chaperone DnaJ-domain superfamily protein [Citrus sinensis]|uniref:Chaperone DnaJ-domain superfamily protein n=1 Tax=Citrus sinensis TaxID=2711 RepID=A0ACB8NDP6_CITSI|nr:Chaperone DnaJ-domain superfamily protein [Citrus sinensis]